MHSREARSIAVTFDDVPFQPVDGCHVAHEEIAEMNRRLLGTLTGLDIPSIGFVNGGALPDPRGSELLDGVLRAWLHAGQDLGNHTYGHCDVNLGPLETFQEDVLAGDPALRKLLRERGRTPRYFRHPYLHTGPDRETRDALERFLERTGYRTAPVTIDIQDWAFASVFAVARRRGDLATQRRIAEAYLPFMEGVLAFFETWSVEVVGYEPPQVLLLHVNHLNADCLPALARTLARRSYEFIPLETALEDPAYRMEDGYVGPDGVSWLHRWALGRGMTLREEPREPAWLLELRDSLAA